MSTEKLSQLYSIESQETYNENLRTPEKAGKSSESDVATLRGLRVGSLLRTWAEVSKINYLSSQPLEVIKQNQSIRRRSIGLPAQEYSIQNLVPMELRNKSLEDLFSEQFPVNVTSLMNEDQLWGCFYVFPELYADVYSPVVKVRSEEDVREVAAGELTRDIVSLHLTYLKRTPILGDFVYIKLDLSCKHLINIDILRHYKYLVYLDISSNYLTELNVLSHLSYLQFLAASFNRLDAVLEYDTPQWLLTEVHYKYNSVKKIRDLTAFWSITILDLSHNNIKAISGLESLRYLRRLDLSFNHIQRLENLDQLRLLWLDLSYNNISTFEFGPQAGLWTLLHLEYLNVNENNLSSMKVFAGCTRLRELHARNNRLSTLLELAVYMRQMRRLIVLDLRANPICSTPGYMDVVLDTFPVLLSLDANELDPNAQRSSKMSMCPDVYTFATRRLLRLLYVEQLSRGRVSPHLPAADNTDVPIVVLVSDEAVGKGKLARRLVNECKGNVQLGILHTTASYHYPNHYKEVSREKFDDMLLKGEFLTYSELNGESYGLSREEANVRDGKIRIVCMDLIGALMLSLRGLRPYLILITCFDKISLKKRQLERKMSRNICAQKRMSLFETPLEKSTLQVLLSGRIIITGILNEILVNLPEEKSRSEFIFESECSLLMDSDARQAADVNKEVNIFNILESNSSSLEDVNKHNHEKNSQLDTSLYSIYKESQGTDEYLSEVNGQNSYLGSFNRKSGHGDQTQSQRHKKNSYLSRPKSVDFSRYASSTWKGLSVAPGSTKSSKSVTFTSQDYTEVIQQQSDPTGLLVEPPSGQDREDSQKSKIMKSISTKLPWPPKIQARTASGMSAEDMDLWLAFLVENGLLQASDVMLENSDISRDETKTIDDPNSIIRQLDFYNKIPSITMTTNIRDEYENIHRQRPGLFWDSVTTDDADGAFKKTKRILKDIMKSQKNLKPMFDIDFANLQHYPTVQKKLTNIRNQIAPQRLFY